MKKNSLKEKLKGVVVPVATPLKKDYSIDHQGLKRLIEFLLQNRVHGIFANGSMGGFAFLTDQQQHEVIERVLELVDGRVPVLAGASDTSSSRVLKKIEKIEQLSVQAFVVLAPYYYIMRQDEIKRFFLKIADHSKKPVIIYDNPRVTNNPLEAETIIELAQHENICGLKISVPDVLKWQELLRADLPIDFSLFAGVEKMMNLPLQLGFDGITGGLHNLIPNLAVELYEATQKRDFELADKIQQHINRFHRVFEIDGGWRGAEAAFQLMGICRKITPEMYEINISEEKQQQILSTLIDERVLRPFSTLSKINLTGGLKAYDSVG